MTEHRTTPAVFEDLAGGILSGTRLPGSRLPTARELAKKWGISVTTANKALGKLVEVGLAVDSGRMRHVGVVSAGTRELRPPIRSLIDDASRTSTDLETLLLLVRGLWEQRELRAGETVEDDRYADLIPAELVWGGAPEPEHPDEVTPDGTMGVAVPADCESEVRSEAGLEPNDHDPSERQAGVEASDGDRDENVAESHSHRALTGKGPDWAGKDEGDWGEVQQRPPWDDGYFDDGDNPGSSTDPVPHDEDVQRHDSAGLGPRGVPTLCRHDFVPEVVAVRVDARPDGKGLANVSQATTVEDYDPDMPF